MQNVGRGEGNEDEGGDEIANRYPPRERHRPGQWWEHKRQRVNLGIAALSVSTPLVEPVTYKQAQQSPEAAQWKAAMDEEIASLKKNDTWTLETVPAGVKPIPVKWVFKIKTNPDGTVERYKARLVAKGFRQRKGNDYNEVFAPVGKRSTMLCLFAKAAKENLIVKQMDVKTAFLNGKLEETIYVDQPPGYEEKGEGVACRLNKALYGLKQAPRAWHQTLKTALEGLGLRQSVADPGLFILDASNLYMLVYVDDALFYCADEASIDTLMAKLMKIFDLRALGETKAFLGMEILRDKEAGIIQITQRRMAADLAERFGMSDAKPRSLPVSPSVKLIAGTDNLDPDVYPYAELVGGLLYLSTCTRPDIAQAVGALSRYMSKPTMEHWTAAKGVLRYVIGTANTSLTFSAAKPELEIYCDADYAGDIDTRRSTTGYVILMQGGAVSWSSRLQPTVAMSTTEAEYMAAAAVTKEALWLRTLLEDLGSPTKTMTIKCDNQGAIKLVKNPIASQRTKHIDVMHHFVREHVASGSIVFEYCDTQRMVADIFTKPLPAVKFMFCKSAMGLD
jgi:hypothetical protein